MWYKVQLRKDGSIASCDLVSDSIVSGNGVFFVEADSPARACICAKKLWVEKYDTGRAKIRDRQKKRRESGICRQCSAPVLVPGNTACVDCQEKKRIRQIKNRANPPSVSRLPPAMTDADKAMAQAKTAFMGTKTHVRLMTLLEVEKQLSVCTSPKSTSLSAPRARVP